VEELEKEASPLQPAAGEALVEMGASAVEELIRSLETGEPSGRWMVVEVLGRIGDPRAVAPLTALLDTSPPDAVRLSAVTALGRIGDPRALEALVGSMKDPLSVVKKRAADALAAIGEPAVEPLVELLGDADPEVQDLAADALVRIGVASVEPLTNVLKGSDPDRRWNAVYALGAIGDPAAVPALAGVLSDADVDLAMAAVQALGAIGGEAPVSALTDAMTARTGALGLACAEALVRIGAPAVDALMGALGGGDLEASVLAGQALVRIGEPAVSPLVSALGREDPLLVNTASRVLTAIGEAAVVPLALAMPEARPAAREAMAETLASIGGEPVLQSMKAALPEWSTRTLAARVLGALGWVPQTPQERVHWLVAGNRRAELVEDWPVTRFVLSGDLTSGQPRRSEYAVRAYIAIGEEAAVGDLLTFFEMEPDESAARLFLDSREPRLEAAARTWFEKRNLDPNLKAPGGPETAGPAPAWGSMGGGVDLLTR
jgi:HEAT repeat protein